MVITWWMPSPSPFLPKQKGDVSGTLLSAIKDSSENKVLLCARKICYGLCDDATGNRRSTQIWQTPTFLVRACFLHHGFMERIKPGLGRPGSTCNPTVYWQHDLGQITFPSVPVSSSAKQIQSLWPPLRVMKSTQENRQKHSEIHRATPMLISILCLILGRGLRQLCKESLDDCTKTSGCWGSWRKWSFT